ncbi:SPOR domain-containing protein [Candidatus Thiodictyon syntrophicum]|jgi:DedD protein|uniref:SPOR domain-containing protein n=1 Tax=Candidatus Thiodictyon syntrophicum TaxID=1166950 RepID=A0A2K8U786_9GAMM|nr:SPOR domain-containing protein [Candidatus Thiodictyon syntrophicum]AUB81407.1 hypothetical protein THSYN_10880 [Candidatus Thiodictyon syntrophicum]
MREGAKQRLIGAVVIVALAVIFVPMLFEPQSLEGLPPIQQSIPRPPPFDPAVKTEIFLGPQDSGVGGLPESGATVSQPLALPPPGEPVRPAAGAAEPAAGAAAKTPAAVAPAAGKPGKAPAPGANAGMPSWVIQVASSPNQAGAAELEGKLRADGFAAFTEKAEVNGRAFYRVQVGPQLERAQAEQTVARLREKHKVDPMIKSYP